MLSRSAAQPSPHVAPGEAHCLDGELQLRQQNGPPTLAATIRTSAYGLQANTVFGQSSGRGHVQSSRVNPHWSQNATPALRPCAGRDGVQLVGHVADRLCPTGTRYHPGVTVTLLSSSGPERPFLSAQFRYPACTWPQQASDTARGGPGCTHLMWPPLTPNGLLQHQFRYVTPGCAPPLSKFDISMLYFNPKSFLVFRTPKSISFHFLSMRLNKQFYSLHSRGFKTKCCAWVSFPSYDAIF